MSSKGAYRVQSPRNANRPQSASSVCPAQAAISTTSLSSARPTGHNLRHLSIQHKAHMPQSLPSAGRHLHHLSVQYRPPFPPSVCPVQAAISTICLSSTGRQLHHLSVQHRPQSLPSDCRNLYSLSVEHKAHRPQSPPCPIFLSSAGRHLHHLSIQHRPKSLPSADRNRYHLSVQHRPKSLPSADRNRYHLSVQHRPQSLLSCPAQGPQGTISTMFHPLVQRRP